MTLDPLETDDTWMAAGQGCARGHPGVPPVRRKPQTSTAAWKSAITPVAVTVTTLWRASRTGWPFV
jgi:hypothetical protein